MALLEVFELRKTFRVRVPGRLARSATQTVQALRGVTLEVEAGETVGLVGETGAGKTTLGRCIAGLDRADAGTIRLQGEEISALKGREFQRMRRHIQMVFQDSYASLNPRRTVGESIEEPLLLLTDLDQNQRRQAVAMVLEEVELAPQIAERYRHELSGGQQQRVNVARAIVIHPDLVLLDEPVSALDASVRGAVIALLKRLQEDHDLAYLMIAHDLHVVREVATRVVIMYDGQILEWGSVEQIFDTPRHPYTQSLLASSLPLEHDAAPMANTSLANGGGRDSWRAERTWVVTDPVGERSYPPLVEVVPGHFVAISIEQH